MSININVVGVVRNIKRLDRTVRASFSTRTRSKGGDTILEWYDVTFIDTKDNKKCIAQAKSLKEFQMVTLEGILVRKEYIRKDGVVIRDVEIKAFKIVQENAARPTPEGIS